MRFLPPAGSSFLKAYKLIISFLPFSCEKEKPCMLHGFFLLGSA